MPLKRPAAGGESCRAGFFVLSLGNAVLLGNDVGLPTLSLHPELINKEIHCAYF